MKSSETIYLEEILTEIPNVDGTLTLVPDVLEIPRKVPEPVSEPVSELSVLDDSYLSVLLESFLNDTNLLYYLEEVKGDFYAIVNTFTYGELAIFILLFVFYLTYLLFKFWSVFR